MHFYTIAQAILNFRMEQLKTFYDFWIVIKIEHTRKYFFPYDLFSIYILMAYFYIFQ